MGRSLKYSEELLLEALIRYSDICTTKIKATELAEWAGTNVSGLEGVKDYHFTRSIKDPRTGKPEKRPVTQKLEEFNASRDIQSRATTNVIVNGCNIDSFFSMLYSEQRKTLSEAQSIISEYRKKNAYLQRQIDSLRTVNDEISKMLQVYAETIGTLKHTQKLHEEKLSFICRVLEDAQLRMMAEEMGISDGDFDLVKYNESLKLSSSSIINIDKEIHAHQARLKRDDCITEEANECSDAEMDLLAELTNFDDI